MLKGSNIERLIHILESGHFSIEGKAISFDMGTYIGRPDVSAEVSNDDLPGRRTVACIAGHSYLMATGATVEKAMAATDGETIETVAADFLGLTRSQANDLFFDLPEEIALMDVSVEQAIGTLKRLLDTGEVRWLAASPM